MKENRQKANPKDFVFKYIVYLPLFIISVIVCVLIAYVNLRYKVSYYNSGVSILIRDDRGSRGNTDALDEIVVFKSRTNLANEIEILKSATLMEKVVRALNLNTQYLIEGNLKRTEMYNNSPFIYRQVSQKDTNAGFATVLIFNPQGKFQVEGLGSGWHHSGELIHGNQGDFIVSYPMQSNFNPEYKYILQWQPPFATAGSIAGGLNVRQLNKDASILRIDLVTEIPQKGVDILNELVNAYNNNTIGNKNRVIENTVRFIDNRLLLLTSDLGKVEQGLQEFRQKNEIIDIQAQGQGQYEQMKSTDQKLGDLEIRLQVIDMIDRYVKGPDKRFSLVPSSLGIDDPTLNVLVEDYNKMQLDREQSLRTMPEANPAIQTMENQIEKVRVSLLENLANIKRSLEPLRNKLLADYNEMRSQVRAVPSKQRELLEIERQQGIKEKLYLFLLQKREESAISIASSSSNSYAVDPASFSWMPVSPDRAGTYRTAVIIGLLLPAAFIYLRELLNDKVTTRADITRTTQMPLLGEITHHKMADREVVIGEKDRSMIAEQFRIARTNLQFFINNKTSPVVLVTSSMPGEGKTFTSMNLGAVWAVANKKTVILELDLRKPKISKALGLLEHKGISNYIIGDARVEELPVMVKNHNNLYIVPAGPIPPNPSELLLDPKIEELFTYLQANFHIIIIDSAPLGLVSDAKVLSRFADALVFIVRQRYTPKKQLEFINDLYTKNTFSNMSLLVNDVKMGGINSYYGYGNGYGYGYSYGYGYGYSNTYSYSEMNDMKRSWWKNIWRKKG